ncbi:MAG: cytidylate kinase [Planctomycetota bacterium]
MLSVVTIDGPAGAGKSTVARRVARELGFQFLDTGAMYRAVTWAATKAGLEAVESADMDQLLEALTLSFEGDGQLTANGTNVTKAIRERSVTSQVSAFAALASVRHLMSRAQREMGEAGNLVCEGRDMGTFVFPDAAVRIYLDASPDVRATRRAKELEDKGETVDFDGLLNEIKARDAADSSRTVAPLKRVPEQHYVDSSEMSREDVISTLLDIARSGLADTVS